MHFVRYKFIITDSYHWWSRAAPSGVTTYPRVHH